jgi:hypothetical protein
MNLTTVLLIIVTATFGVYSGYVMLEFGYLGIWRSVFVNAATVQVILDLTIVCSLISVWMVRDARKSGRNPWPYVLITFTAGSFGPLIYLLAGQRRGAR